MPGDNFSKFRGFREKHPEFVYERFHINRVPDAIEFGFEFHVSGLGTFRPWYRIIPGPWLERANENSGTMENLVFHIGLIELISYWKIACPPTIRIQAGRLDERQVKWWRSLYFHGLGEFFYTNGISVSQDEFIQEIITEGRVYEPISPFLSASVLVPSGGGKDSAVSVELLRKQNSKLVPFALNPRSAIWKSLENAGFDYSEIVVFERTLDPLMLELNAKGYLNGHTPFSALLAFNAMLAATLSGCHRIALSNESSASEATIPGTMINHQYSKSYHFERAFRDYSSTYLTKSIEYFSLLRPVNELQIAGMFSQYPSYFNTFKSCNAGSKEDRWCGKCPKCLFTWLILSPFLKPDVLETIFGKNLLDDNELQSFLMELSGRSPEKPFECVGTINEVKAAIGEMIRKNYDNNMLPVLLQGYEDLSKNADFTILLHDWSEEHFVPKDLINLLKAELYG